MTVEYLFAQSAAILPELFLAAALCVVIFADMLTPLRYSRAVCGTLAAAGAVAALVALLSAHSTQTFSNMVAHDQLRTFFGIMLLGGALIIFLFSMRSRETAGYRQGEYFALLLGAVLGAMLLVSADNLLLFVLGLETLSLCSYVLAGFIKHERASAEASLKYIIYGAVVSGVLMFGLSYVYGMSGTLSIQQAVTTIGSSAARGTYEPLTVVLVLGLILVGIGFKIAMVPFHFWCPDVYQGSPTPVTAFLAVVSKTAGFGALIRLMLPLTHMAPFPLTQYILPILFGVLAVVTMTYGNLVAIRQTDVKRLLAYSSIAHAGYLLMPMSVWNGSSMQAILFYLFVYLFMNLGAFWVVIALVNRVGSAQIDRFRGMAYRAPFLFAAMFIFLISLTGIPPTVGFVGKFMLFKEVVAAGITQMGANGAISPMAGFYFAIAFAGVINSAISLYYYMKIAKAMAFEKPEEDVAVPDSGTAGLWDAVYAGALAAPVLLLLYFEPVLQLMGIANR